MKLLRVLPLIALLAFPSIAFCNGKGHLYNLKTGETLAVEFTRAIWTGHGKIWAIYPNGKKLQGEYSATRAGGSSWGSIYYSGGSATSNGYYSSSVAKGSAILTGQDTIIECEFLAGGGLHGSGSCRDQAGDFYKFIF